MARIGCNALLTDSTKVYIHILVLTNEIDNLDFEVNLTFTLENDCPDG